MRITDRAFLVGTMAAAQRLAGCCCIGDMLLWTLFRPVQHRG